MSTELKRFSVPVIQDRLLQTLMDPDGIETESLRIRVDFKSTRDTFARLRSAYENPGDLGDPSGILGNILPGTRRSRPRRAELSQRPTWDREMIEPLHLALKGLPRRVATDMRFWHWLCIVEFPDFVWLRWHGSVPEGPSEQIGSALSGRFLGTPTLNGVSRNALARLWWCAEALYSQEDDYVLVRRVMSNQDLFQAIFERKFGLYPQAARAVLSYLSENKEPHRLVAKRLNHYLTTIAVEILGEEEIVELLST